MNIEFERTVDDIIDFNLFHMAHSPSVKKQLLIIQIFIGIIIIPLIFMILYLLVHTMNAFTLIISILVGILAFALYPQVSRKLTISHIVKILSEGNNKAMLGHQIISFSPEGIFSKNNGGESKINWSAVDKLVQSDKHFLLYTGSINALVIPKNCLPLGKEQEDFLEYVNMYLQKV